MSNTAIKVSHLTKVYKLYNKPIDRFKESLHPLKKQYHKKFFALDDVSFEIKKGETVGIIGQNGAGKSTLLKIITGVLTSTSGDIQINGRISSLLELGAGFNPEYTGMENIYLQGLLIGFSHEEMESKIDDIVQFADIDGFINQPVKIYSSGMFARLAFAIAINVEPDILIVDEALAVGDVSFVNKCYSKLNALQSKGVTLLFVSHSIDAVISLCSKAILLKGGECLLYDKVETVINMYNKITRPVSSMKKNILEKTESGSIPEDELFIYNKEFMQKHLSTRYGSGGAIITNIEIVNEEELKNRQFTFNTTIKLRIYIESKMKLNNFNCGYFIKSDKGILVLGNNFESEGIILKQVVNNKKIIVEFDINLCIKSGIYSITVALGATDDDNNQYIVDWVDLADSFEVYHRENQYSFEQLVYIPAKISTYNIN